MRKLTLLFLGCIFCNYSNSQDWSTSLNNSGAGLLGTTFNQPINIFTNNIQRARFTTGTALTTPWDAYAPIDPMGDGLRILGSGNLDLFTGLNSTTHIKFGGSGAISGQNSRMEYFAAGTGFYMNT